MKDGQRFSRVFVTGAANGIGRRLAELALEDGADVAGFDLTNEGLSELSGAADRLGRRVHVEAVDVRQADAVSAAVNRAAEAIGPPDLAINCAGIQLAKPFEELSGEEFGRVIEVNLVGSRNFAAASLPHLGPGDRLALVASLAGLVPNYSYAAYTASKYAVVGLAEVLRLEYAPRGIGVSVVCPPEVETNLVYEERKTQHPASAALKRTAGTLDVHSACQEIFAGLRAGGFMVIPSRRARAVAWMGKYVPRGLAHAGTDLAVRRALRRSG
ncbi:MAG TPA: SDR family NAD(P)-dependent oxidoreductase [Solirubrobacteraceae bacterium]|nr:SDR family NAD(P)-dependent oxidoreductase [Solirubrobacteraceae bacterium]